MLKLSTKNATTNQVFKNYQPRLKKAEKSLLKKRHSQFLFLPDQDPKEITKDITPLKNKFTDIVVIGIGGSILGTILAILLPILAVIIVFLIAFFLIRKIVRYRRNRGAVKAETAASSEAQGEPKPPEEARE